MAKNTTNGTATKATKGTAIDQATRDAAKAAGLSPIKYIVLKALVKFERPMTYRDIEAKTGYYSVLTSVLRAQAGGSKGQLAHEESLGALGLVREEMHPSKEGGREVLHFVATAKGKKIFQAKAPKAPKAKAQAAAAAE